MKSLSSKVLSVIRMNTEKISWDSREAVTLYWCTLIEDFHRQLTSANLCDPDFFEEAQQALHVVVHNQKQLKFLLELIKQLEPCNPYNRIIEELLILADQRTRVVLKRLRRAVMKFAVGSEDADYFQEALQSDTHILAISLRQLHDVVDKAVYVSPAVLLPPTKTW